MSFGFGVGDFLAALELGKKIYDRFSGAPEQYADVVITVKVLTTTLTHLQQLQSSKALLSEEQQNELKSISDSCLNNLKSLNGILDKYMEIESKSSRNVLKRAWKRITYEPEDVRDIRVLLIQNIGFLTIFLQKMNNLMTYKIKEAVDEVTFFNRNQEKKEQDRKILHWVSPSDYSTRHSDIYARRVPGTGEWLLNSPSYQTWKKEHNKVLFCPGIPGAGKTVLTSIVIHDLFSVARNRDEGINALLFIYFNYKDRNEQKTGMLWASLLRQLLNWLPFTPPIVEQFYEERHRERQLDQSEILYLLNNIRHYFANVYIVLDAVDEFDDPDDDSFLVKLIDIQQTLRFAVFVTSRPIATIESLCNDPEQCTRLEIQARKEDISLFIELQSKTLSNVIKKRVDLQQKIREIITVAVDGMFLLARLHLDSLRGLGTAKEVSKTLQSLSSGASSYQSVYGATMDRIKDQPPSLTSLALEALNWVCFAKRPLHEEELRYAIGIEVDETEFDEDNLPEIEDIMTATAGLLVVEPQSKTIRLVHKTAQEYIENNTESPREEIELFIAEKCAAYLTLDHFRKASPLKYGDISSRSDSFPFLGYSAENWHRHAKLAGPVSDKVTEFLDSPRSVMVAEEYVMAKQRRNFNEGKKGLHVTAKYGLDQYLPHFLKATSKLDVKDSTGVTPLAVAAEANSVDIVKQLLASHKVDINSVDGRGNTPLIHAVLGGALDAAKELLQVPGIDVNIPNGQGYTALCYATFRSLDMVKLLVEEGKVDTHAGDFAALQLATQNGNLEAAKILIEKAISDDRTPTNSFLFTALPSNQREMMELVIEHLPSSSVDRDHIGRTPLIKAAQMGYEESFQALLELPDVDVNNVCYKGRTALSYAAERGHTKIIEILIGLRNTDLDLPDKSGRTPLSYAAGQAQVDAVKLLLGTKRVNVNSVDRENEWTPLAYTKEENWPSIHFLGMEEDTTDKTDAIEVVRLLTEAGGVEDV